MSGNQTTVPRASAGRWRVRGPRDFYGGLAFMALAAFAFWLARDLPGMAGASFGPGTAPRLVAGLLFIAGAAVAISGLLVDGPPIEGYALRGPAYVIAAIVVFAITLRGIGTDLFGMPLRIPQLGLVLSTFGAFMIAIMGSREMRWAESLAAAAAMTAFCVLLFIYLLRLPIELWPAL